MKNANGALESYRVTGLVGGARKTCVLKREGFSKFARELAMHFLQEAGEERYKTAYRTNRDGYILGPCTSFKVPKATAFKLVDPEAHDALLILKERINDALIERYTCKEFTSGDVKHRPFGVHPHCWV